MVQIGMPARVNREPDRVFTETLIYPRFRGVTILESGGDACPLIYLLILILVLRWREHIERAVTPFGVLKELDVAVDGGGELPRSSRPGKRSVALAHPR